MENDAFKVVLEVELDKNSKKDVNDQLLDVQKGLEPLGVKVNIDEKQFKDIIGRLGRVTSSTQMFDTTNGKKIIKQIDEIVDSKGRLIKLTTEYDKESGKIVRTLEQQRTNYEAQRKEVEKLNKAREKEIFNYGQNKATEEYTLELIEQNKVLRKQEDILESIAKKTSKMNDSTSNLVRTNGFSDLKDANDLIKTTSQLKKQLSEIQKMNKNGQVVSEGKIRDLKKELEIHTNVLKLKQIKLDKENETARIVEKNNKLGEEKTRQLISQQKQLDKFISRYEELNKSEHYKDNDGADLAKIEEYQKKINSMSNNWGKTISAKEKTQLAEMNYELDKILSKGEKQIAQKKQQIALGEKQEKQENQVLILREKALARLDKITSKNTKFDMGQYGKLRNEVMGITSETKNFTQEFQKANIKISEFETASKKASMTTGSFADTLKRFSTLFGFYEILQLTKRGIGEMVESVFELDKALVELQKTSDLGGASLEAFINQAYAVGDKLARTGSDVIRASGEFSKAGFASSDLLALSETALLLTNVGDGMTNVSEASGTLISAMKGFKIEASDAVSIVDKINNVSNNTASNFSDISFGLERMSGTLGMAGASIDQTIAMFTSINEVLRNSEMTSSGLNSVFMRMRGLSEETGESVDGLVAKLEGVYSQVGITLMDEDGQLRNTFDVLQDLSEVWGDLTINQRQYLAEKSAG